MKNIDIIVAQIMNIDYRGIMNLKELDFLPQGDKEFTPEEWWQLEEELQQKYAKITGLKVELIYVWYVHRRQQDEN